MASSFEQGLDLTCTEGPHSCANKGPAQPLNGGFYTSHSLSLLAARPALWNAEWEVEEETTRLLTVLTARPIFKASIKLTGLMRAMTVQSYFTKHCHPLRTLVKDYSTPRAGAAQRKVERETRSTGVTVPSLRSDRGNRCWKTFRWMQ
ncbi:hypothetical protein GJAV_G00174100 [Gymnothorax javanicus]|nr:hypothetical protein GJAV_G00174100 [Gymnothorax javanicus]